MNKILTRSSLLQIIWIFCLSHISLPVFAINSQVLDSPNVILVQVDLDAHTHDEYVKGVDIPTHMNDMLRSGATFRISKNIDAKTKIKRESIRESNRKNGLDYRKEMMHNPILDLTSTQQLLGYNVYHGDYLLSDNNVDHKEQTFKSQSSNDASSLGIPFLINNLINEMSISGDENGFGVYFPTKQSETKQSEPESILSINSHDFTDLALSKLEDMGDAPQPFLLSLSFKDDSSSTRGSVDEGERRFDKKMSDIDESVGSMIAYLKSTDKWDNTVLLFQSNVQLGSDTLKESHDRNDQSTDDRYAILGGGFAERSFSLGETGHSRLVTSLRLSNIYRTFIDMASTSVTSTETREELLYALVTGGKGRRLQSEEVTSSRSPSSRVLLSNTDILSKLYETTNGTLWTIPKTNWMSGDPCISAWHGVTCSLSEVTGLDLSDNNLQGSLPSQLGQLTSIMLLGLGSNSLTKSLPSEIGLLTAMTTDFYINSNRFTGLLPSQLGQLTSLTSFFYIFSNSFTGLLPSQLGQLTSMSYYLSISANSFTGLMPSQLGQLIYMSHYFQVYSNSFTGFLPSQLGQLTSMSSYFQVYSNGLSGLLPSQLGQLISLNSYFNIYRNNFTGLLPSQLGQLISMTSVFYVYSNGFSGPLPSQLGLLSKATTSIIYTYNSFCGDLPSEVTALSSQTSDWITTTGTYIGTPCCIVLSSAYTCSPTPVPTSPTVVPTNTPTMMPINRRVLAELYTATGGSNWTSKMNWLHGHDPCPSGGWFGVRCNSTNVIRDLDISSNRLQGSLPSQLGLLTAMTSFKFIQNLLTGNLPSEIGMFTAITTEFNIFQNSFSGLLPSQLGQLTSMGSRFSVNQNGFTGLLPSQLGQLTSMSSYFKVNLNSFTGMLPSQLGQLTLSSRFYISENNVTGMLPSQLGQLTSMVTRFYINLNSFTGLLPSQLGQLTSMSAYFQINSNHFTGTLPSQLGRLTSMTAHFYIDSNSFLGSLPSQLGLLSKATNSISYTDNSFCGDLPSEVTALSSQTSDWVTTTGTYIGTPCCIVLPSTYTCSPTLVPTPVTYDPSPVPTPIPTTLPTLRPSIVPTLLPTPVPTLTLTPTPFPTMIPTIIPTIVPSIIPTLVPSPVPSFSPTAAPTPTPTPLPTPVPTAGCESGTYLDGTVCTTCAVGQYSSFDTLPFPTSCKLCPSGRYNTAAGATECTNCAAGKLSSDDRTYCKDCDAGEYNHNNTECRKCEYGKYAPQALTDSCLECLNGSHTNNQTKATTCTPCDAGKYSTKLVSECTSCSIGSHSSSGASQCELCPVGFYAAVTGSSSCIACSAGNYTSVVGSFECTKCEKGTSQGSTGQSDCVQCEKGKFAAQTGSVSCDFCDSKKDSLVGSESCDLANSGYYLANDNGDSKICPNHASCEGGYQVPIPDYDYWVDRTKHEFVGDVYKCSRDTCQRNSINSSCWQIDQFANTTCSSDELQCTEGAMGPLCGSCHDGYVFQAVLNECRVCGEVQIVSYILFGSVMALALIIVVYFLMGDVYGIKQWWIIRFLLNLERGSLKVLWVTYQIIVSSSYALGVQFPSPFSGMLGFLSIFSFDFLALKCFSEGNDAYYNTIYLWCALPIVLTAVIIGVGVFRLPFRLKDSTQVAEEQFNKIKNTHIWLVLLLSYVVLPPVSNKQLQVFDCIDISGNRYLRADTAIDCDASDYLIFRGIIILFIGVYQMIPILWMILLYQKRDALSPKTSSYDTRLAMFIRDNNSDLASLRFLFVDYKCSKWWFEIADMYRRIIFLSIIPLVSSNPATRASFGCILAIMSVAYFREEQPYRFEFTNTIAHIAQFCILITIYGALTIETSSMISFGLKGHLLGYVLVFLNLIVAILALWLAFVSFKKQKRLQELKELKAALNEDTRGFTQNKYNTTFEALWKHSVPSSHTLVFYYTSYQQALIARKSGIVAQRKFNGIPLTLRQPLASTESEFKVFGENGEEGKVFKDFPNEEALVLSLPKQFLEPLKGFEEDDGLCMISVELLNAMRSTSFTAVLDPQSWLDGFTMLPPQCILRSFLVMNKASSFERQVSSSKSIYSSRNATKSLSNDANSHHKPREPTDDFHIDRSSISSSTFGRSSPLVVITSVEMYIKAMGMVRQKTLEQKLVPLFHYTSKSVASMILNGGLRMSTQGQGDGGVYVSTQGPASYGLGTDDYEVNIIKDCFGVERVNEYLGKGKLDVVLVYACEARALQQAPGGRDNAKMVSKSTFRDFSLEHHGHNYFLRPDRIFGAFYLDPTNRPVLENVELISEMVVEKNRESQVYEKLANAEKAHRSNVRRIENQLNSIWDSFDELQLKTLKRKSDISHIPLTRFSRPSTNRFSSSAQSIKSAVDVEMTSITDIENTYMNPMTKSGDLLKNDNQSPI